VEKKRINGRYTLEFQQYAVERMKVSANISALAKELGIPRVRLYKWQKRLDPGQERAVASYTAGDGEQFLLGQQLREVKQLLAEKTMEVDFFKGALQKVAARRQKNAAAGGTASTSKSGR